MVPHLLLLFSLLFVLLISLRFASTQLSVDHCEWSLDDPRCLFRPFADQRNPPMGEPCHYRDLWLIPGRADSSCTRANPKRLARVDARQVRVLPSVIKLPGCFTIEIRHIQLLDSPDSGGNRRNSIFAKTEYQWLNAVGSGESKCQNASLDGCGGFGNNCYYCDICESLSAIDEHPEKSDLPVEIAEQLKNMNCPDKPGTYTFRKQFCFSDWHILDSNKDCHLDLLDPSSKAALDDQSGLRTAMASLQQVGYGTVVAKVRLAYNATPEIERKKAQKEAQIERTAEQELKRRKANWDSKKGDFANYSRWFMEQQKGRWHKEEYLPWLLYENEIACIRLTFDVCERQPQESWDGGPSGGYICT